MKNTGRSTPVRGRWWRDRAGLLRQHNFRLLWGGEFVSNTGGSIASVALPLVAVATLHATALEVSGLTAATYLPYLLFGLPAGAWVDRLPCRPVMIVCDIVQLLFFVSVSVASVLGALTIAQLLGVALLAGTAAMVFSSAYTVYLTTLVRPEELLEGNAKLQGSSAATRTIGPGIGGVLVQAVGAAPSLLFDAGSFLVSAACLARIDNRGVHDPRAPRDTTIRSDIGEGLRLVAHDAYLRPLAVFAALTNLGLSGYLALIVVFLVRSVHLEAGLVGAVLTVGGAGGVLGAFTARRLTNRLGTARTLIANSICLPGGLIMVLAQRGPLEVLAVIGVFIVEGGLVIGSVILASFQQSYVAPDALGRVTTSMRMVTYGIAPFGALVAGILADALGPRLALTVMLAVSATGALPLLASPLRGRRELPERAELVHPTGT